MGNGTLEGNGIEVGFGKLRVGARGLGVAVVVGVAVVIGANLWAGYRIEQTFERVAVNSHIEHRALTTAMNVQACMQSFDFGERKGLRDALGYARSSREAFHILTAWCPWMSYEERK